MNINDIAGAGLRYNELTNKLDVTYENIGTLDVSLRRDPNPTLNYNLQLNNKSIIGKGEINIDGGVIATGIIGNQKLTIEHNVINTGGRSLEIIGAGRFNLTAGNSETNPISINFNASRGPVDLPTDIQVNDDIGTINFNAYSNGSYISKAVIKTTISENRSIDNLSSGQIGIFIKGNNPNSASPNQPGWYEYLFYDDGIFSAPSIQTGSYDGSAKYPSPAKPGMIIFDCNLNQFFGYNGTKWKQLSN